jgi:hypothetical protein
MVKAKAQESIRFDSTGTNPVVRFVYPDHTADTYLTTLKQEHLASAASNQGNDLQHVLAIVNWTHSLWRHNGRNEPSRQDALTIIKEAKEGKNFRCVEYARVSADALLALGIKARVLALKTKNAETKKSGAGHVLTEAWLPAYEKWVLADAQFNLVPTVDNVPLNAVELQQAIAAKRKITFVDASGPVSEGRGNRYLRFITPYLYFFDVELDQQQIPYAKKFKIDQASSLMLVPLGARNPAVFQKRFPLDYVMYTNSLKDFYQAPDAGVAK